MMINGIWKGIKKWRIISIGPLAVLFKVQRSVRVTRNARQNASAVGQMFGDRRRAHRARSSSLPSPILGTDPQLATAQLALVVGVGPGFGHAVARRLAKEGMTVILVSRDAERLDKLVEDIGATGGMAFAYGCDATNEDSVAELFQDVVSQHGIPDLVVYSLHNFGPGQVVDIELPAFEDGWKFNCLGSFLVARQSARLMLGRGSGSIILTGSTSSMIGRAGHLNLAVGKFGQRAIAQVLARELWPKGIHVAHLVIDADIHEGTMREDDGPQSNPADIAELLLSIHRQPKSAWTSEVDVRPFNEQFWEHC